MNKKLTKIFFFDQIHLFNIFGMLKIIFEFKYLENLRNYFIFRLLFYLICLQNILAFKEQIFMFLSK
jgi:hypothetical protein